MNSKWLWVVLTAGMCLSGVVRADEAARLLKDSGGGWGFSYAPPEGWMVGEKAANMKFRPAFGPEQRGLKANIMVTTDLFLGSPRQYTVASLEAMRKRYKEFALIDEADFATEGGLQGRKLVVEHTPAGERIRQSFYVFERVTTVIVVACTVHAEKAAEMDPLFDKSMKTFMFDE